MSRRQLLIVDDKPNLRESFKIGLELKGYAVTIADSGKQALKICEKKAFDAVLLDVRMPEMDGLETLRHLMDQNSEQVVIMLTAHGSITNAVEAGQIGACNYLEKPSTPEAVDIRIQNSLERHNLSKENRQLKSQLREKNKLEGIVGTSESMQEVYGLVERITATESTALITDETGTGKGVGRPCDPLQRPSFRATLLCPSLRCHPRGSSWRASFSATKRVPSPEQSRRRWASSRPQIQAPSFWMKSAK